MKKEYNFWVNKQNVPNLELYTKLLGVFYGTLGFNFLLCFLYAKYIIEYEFSILILMLSLLMFMLTPVAMTDSKRESRNLIAVIMTGVAHTVCTIGSIVMLQFWELVIIYGIEILGSMILIFKNLRVGNKKGRR